MKLVMTLLVRDSVELLRDNIEFHLQQGVDFFIITDNCSTDGTATIIDEYVRVGLAESIFEPEDTYSQARWVTRMARLAAFKHGADWVINNDDDEFWRGREGTLREELERVIPELDAVTVQRRNHPPLAVSGDRHFLQAMIYREQTSLNALGKPLKAKVCHRGSAEIEVAQGNHAVARAGARLAVAPTDRIVISHFPLRSYPAFERRIAHGGRAYARNTELGPGVGATWRWLYKLLQQGQLRRWYEQQLLADDRVIERLADGSLVIDDTVLRALASMTEGSCRPAA